MQPYVIILAGTSREAAMHAKRHRLQRQRYRYALRADHIRGVRRADIHILPGFSRRLDRFGILGALKHCRGEQIKFDEPIGYLRLEDAIEPAYAEQERRLNAGRLSVEEALEQAYVTRPAPYSGGYLPPGSTPKISTKPERVLSDVAVKRKTKSAQPKPVVDYGELL